MALWRLAHNTGEMDNKFSQLARDEYWSFLLMQNVSMLVAYALLWIAGILLVLPVVATFRARFPKLRKVAVFAIAFLAALGIHAFFMLRLAHSRPYFIADAEFGQWYYQILRLPPASWQVATDMLLFAVLPWSFVALVAVWWMRRMAARWRWAAIGCGLTGVLMVSLWPQRGGAAEQPAAKGKQPPNIIIIGSDSLRGDRLGFTGYRPARSDGEAAAGVSPRIDEWAENAAKFTRCYTPIASTLESSVSVMSASFPHTHGIRQMYPRREQVEKTESKILPMAEVLTERGYDTAAIGDWCAGFYDMMPLGFRDISVSTFDNFRIYMSQAVVMAHFVVPLYFDNPLGYRLFPQIGSFAQFVTPEVVTRRVEDKLAQQAARKRPFFWHVFYSCNHLPYASAERYNRMFTDPAYQGRNRNKVDFDINEFVSGTGLEDKMAALPEEEIRQIRGMYDGCTRQFDECFGRIMDALKVNGLADNTIVVVTADHGDDLYEPGVTLTHGLGFNGGDHCSHIPMVISGPGVKGQTLPEQVRSIDLAPTLLDLAGLDRPERWEGRSTAGWIRGEEPPRDRAFYGETSFPFIQFRVDGVERPYLPPMDELTTIDPAYNHQFVMLEKWDQPVVAAKQRCMRTRDWKIVATPSKEGGRHYGLFHLPADPDCRHDLAGERPEVLGPMRTAIDRWIDDRLETEIHEIFPGGEP
ncbi:sulfatase-like hydrolase/transferase [Luteolibacter marinus]|uniref:sulfatase-like hydrolase/transferase n=1 Tax=Luteolibacter marinus TaxID=2776705 RepID=UPI0018693060|nr:sulfatase-like hydrolase/transferase [Luteolibacter marinus]